MVTQSSSFASPALLLIGLLLLWFYTIWQSYVIEGTRTRLAGLQEIWRETLSGDPALPYCPPVRTVQRLLDSSRETLPRFSLSFLCIAALAPRRERDVARVRVYEHLRGLPSSRLQQDAIGIVEAAARFVAIAALKRSLLAWALAPLFVAGFIVWSVSWHFRLALEDAPQGSLHLARIRLRRKFLEPLVDVVMSVCPT